MNCSIAATMAAASSAPGGGTIVPPGCLPLSLAPVNSERDVAVLALRPGFALAEQSVQGHDQLGTRLVGDDDIVDVAALGGRVRVGKPGLVILHELGSPLIGRGAVSDVSPVDDVDGALGAHHRDLGCRPGEV